MNSNAALPLAIIVIVFYGAVIWALTVWDRAVG